MLNLTKLATFLESVGEQEPNYDYACYIKEKLAEDVNDPLTVNNGEETELTDPDVTSATPEQQTSDNFEGSLMDGAFEELEVQNIIDDEKDKIDPPSANSSSQHKTYPADQQQKVAEALNPPITFYDMLRSHLAKS
jgi:hypothetical protein